MSSSHTNMDISMAESTITHKELGQIAKRIKINILKMVYEAQSGHPGGSLSAADIMTVLYFKHLNHRPNDPDWSERDRFVLSKGHATPVYFATLAEAGYLPQEELKTFRKINSRLQGHPASKYIKGIEVSTGALGQGLSMANGMALAYRLDKKQSRIYVMMGDGELQEGNIWEAAMTAGHYKLSNLTGIVDNNNLQIDGDVRKIMNVHPIGDKFKAFGWNTIEIDGHSIPEIDAGFTKAKEYSMENGKPTVIIAKTVKGKGVSFMENKSEWHGKAPNEEQYKIAMAEIESL